MGDDQPRPASLFDHRWVQLTASVLAMIAVANFQYSWTLFVLPMQTRHGWTEEAIQVAMYLFFIPAQTWLVPVEGYLADRFGPRRLLLVGGFLAGLAWTINAETASLPVLYAAQIVAGCGSGIVYSISVGSALKWFPDRRGLAAGITAAAFGTGSALTVLPIEHTIESTGYEAAFLWFGIGQGLVIMLAGAVMRFPRPAEVPLPAQPRVLQTNRDVSPGEMLRSPLFWLLYLMMTLGAIPGLLMMGQLKPMARDFGISQMQVTLFGLTQVAPLFALMIDRLAGGLTRPVFGALSDLTGREVAIFFAFALEGASILVLTLNQGDPALFVLMSGLAFFGWGAIFSLFPALSSDMFGRKFATANYGWLYTAKGTASLLILFGNHLRTVTGNWTLVLALLIAFDWLAALLALFVLLPLRRQHLALEKAAA
jgi:OFA family oxalate/formate antiporter-like MFS transporter